ncbi:uncharacterized protein LOC119094232 [Pollicipes pollicipes]|uniref:uncharacterized protein LOC119094232 n=1 Tax=Pollicipes pollicipes TaxID=41117 RepID=UPI0018855C25|nr:uncharacterized protein LOC119094232 [Pollicipes pollicipes]
MRLHRSARLLALLCTLAAASGDSLELEERLLEPPRLGARLEFDAASGATLAHYVSRQRRSYRLRPPEMFAWTLVTPDPPLDAADAAAVGKLTHFFGALLDGGDELRERLTRAPTNASREASLIEQFLDTHDEASTPRREKRGLDLAGVRAWLISGAEGEGEDVAAAVGRLVRQFTTDESEGGGRVAGTLGNVGVNWTAIGEWLAEAASEFDDFDGDGGDEDSWAWGRLWRQIVDDNQEGMPGTRFQAPFDWLSVYQTFVQLFFAHPNGTRDSQYLGLFSPSAARPHAWNDSITPMRTAREGTGSPSLNTPMNAPAARHHTSMVAAPARDDYVYDYEQWEYEYFHAPPTTTERTTPRQYPPNRTEAGQRVAKIFWSHWTQLKPHCISNVSASDSYARQVRRAGCATVKLLFGEGDWASVKLSLKAVFGPIFTVAVIMTIAWLLCGACNVCQFCPCAWCNPSQLREAICDLINRAMPGLRLYKDGTMEMYVPSQDETDAFQDLVDAIMDFK